MKKGSLVVDSSEQDGRLCVHDESRSWNALVPIALVGAGGRDEWQMTSDLESSTQIQTQRQSPPRLALSLGTPFALSNEYA